MRNSELSHHHRSSVFKFSKSLPIPSGNSSEASNKSFSYWRNSLHGTAQFPSPLNTWNEKAASFLQVLCMHMLQSQKHFLERVDRALLILIYLCLPIRCQTSQREFDQHEDIFSRLTQGKGSQCHSEVTQDQMVVTVKNQGDVCRQIANLFQRE